MPAVACCKACGSRLLNVVVAEGWICGAGFLRSVVAGGWVDRTEFFTAVVAESWICSAWLLLVSCCIRRNPAFKSPLNDNGVCVSEASLDSRKIPESITAFCSPEGLAKSEGRNNWVRYCFAEVAISRMAVGNSCGFCEAGQLRLASRGGSAA